MSLSSDQLEQMCERLCFDGMKRESSRYQPVSVTWTNNFQFLRKGCVGDSIGSFTPEQHRKFDSMIEEAHVPEWFKRLNIHKKYKE